MYSCDKNVSDFYTEAIDLDKFNTEDYSNNEQNDNISNEGTISNHLELKTDQSVTEGGQLGIKNVVCTFGARITEQQIRLLMNFDTIILAFDNDETGQYAIRKAIENYKYLINIKVLILNEQKDVGEIKTIEEFKECKIVDYKNFK